MAYRKVGEISKEEFLAALTTTPQYQIAIFTALGGDPNDHEYAYLSLLTRQLRDEGHDIQSSNRKGVWLGGGESDGS